MGNLLSHGHGSGSPGAVPDHVAGDGYTSEGFVAGSSSSRERKKGIYNSDSYPISLWDW